MTQIKPDTHRICLVMAYFGKWPTWMPYFLESCRGNRRFTWIIFSDIGELPRLCENVKVVPISLQEVKRRTEVVTGFPVNLEHTYKLCDLKPLYGEIFREELSSFDFWGYTDLDLIYGNLDRFVTDAVLQECDVFTAAPRVIVGHFTLFRNAPAVSGIFRTIADCQRILQSYEYGAFDENAFAEELKRRAGQGTLRLQQADVQMDDLHFLWQRRRRFLVVHWQGRLWDAAQFRELAYFHFISLKHSPRFCVGKYEPDSITVITQNGIRCIRGFRGQLHLYLCLLTAAVAAVPWNSKRIVKAILRIARFRKSGTDERRV